MYIKCRKAYKNIKKHLIYKHNTSNIYTLHISKHGVWTLITSHKHILFQSHLITHLSTFCLLSNYSSSFKIIIIFYHVSNITFLRAWRYIPRHLDHAKIFNLLHHFKCENINLCIAHPIHKVDPILPIFHPPSLCVLLLVELKLI